MIYIEIKNYLPISQFHFFVFIFGMLTCPMWGQVIPKKLLKESDFKKWEILRNPQLSNDGNWVSYPIDYIELMDTLVVMNPTTNSIFKIAGGSEGTFVPGNKTRWFVFNKKNKGVGLMDLNNGSIKWIAGSDYYSVSLSGEFIACIKDGFKNNKDLILLQPGKGEEETIKDITGFAFSSNGKQLAYSINRDHISKIVIRDEDKIQYSHSAKQGKHFYHKIVWNPEGTAVSFMNRSIIRSSEAEMEIIVNWNFKRGTINVLNPLQNEKLSGHKILSNLLYYSEDGSKLIFNITPVSQVEKEKQSKVQVWKGTDRWVYPRRQNSWKWENQWWKTVWWPKTNKLLQIGNKQTPQAIINPNQKYAVTYSQIQYEPLYFLHSASDLYAVDLKTGVTNLIVKRQKISSGWVQISPSGNYLSYFKDKNWWVYDFINGTNVCITESLNVKFYSENTVHSSQDAPYGNPGWTVGDSRILLYDKYDLWSISPDGSNAQRLTQGREEEVSFRIDNYTSGRLPYRRSIFENYSYNIDDCPLLLLAKKQGIPFAYYQVDYKRNNLLVANKTGKIGNLSKAKYSNTFTFTQESAEQSPALFYLESNAASLLKIYQSNPQQNEYLWGRTERFTFHTKDGKKLNALLHYPDNFKMGKKYPMIVYIYEKKSQDYADYVYPTYYEYGGFNSKVYTASGYFVLEPDISYTIGTPGTSALNCVVAAVQEVLEKQVVDKDNIGLIGHSFGGYETTFIISQTDTFKTAVAGAPITDLTSYYFSISAEGYQPEIWRFENQQWRMGFPYFANKQAYLDNSPLQHADQIDCPLLLWAGGKDNVVPYSQSVELYLALRRLQQEVVFLLYPDESHALMQKKNQYDLSKRIKAWFDNYLK